MESFIKICPKCPYFGVLDRFYEDNSINILNAKGKEEKISILNDNLLNKNIITKVEWGENRSYLTIGNNVVDKKWTIIRENMEVLYNFKIQIGKFVIRFS